MVFSSREQLGLACVPTDEQCVPAPYRTHQQRETAYKECHRFLNLLKTKFGDPPTGAHLSIESRPYGIHNYYEVAVTYNTFIDEAKKYAFALEANMPSTWSDNEPIDWRTLEAD